MKTNFVKYQYSYFSCISTLFFIKQYYYTYI